MPVLPDVCSSKKFTRPTHFFEIFLSFSKKFEFDVESARSLESLEMIDAHTNRTVGRASIQGPDTKEYTYQYTETPLMCVPPKSLVIVIFGTFAL